MRHNKVPLKIKSIFRSIIPTKNQWKKWSLPSKLTTIGAYIGIIAFVFALIIYAVDKPIQEKIALELISKDDKLYDLIKSTKIDPRDIESSLNKIPFDRGKEEAEDAITQLYRNKDISLELKEILLTVSKQIFERTSDLAKEIKILKSKGNSYLAETLEKIKLAVERNTPNNLLNIYENYNKREQENRIHLLNELIKSSISIFAFDETKKLYSILIDLEPTIENNFDFAEYLGTFNFLTEGIRVYEGLIIIYKNLSKEKQKMYLPYLAASLRRMANLYSQKTEFSKAQNIYKESLKIERELAKKYPNIYLPNIAITLNNLGNINLENKEYKQASEKYHQALRIYREAVKGNPNKHLPSLALILNNLGNMYLENNEYNEALKKYNEALKIRKELAKGNPQKYLPIEAETLHNLGLYYSKIKQFKPSLEKYEEALDIYRVFAKENPRVYKQYLGVTLYNIATLHTDENKVPQVLEKYEEAIKIFKELANENPQKYLVLLHGALGHLANLHANRNEISQALEKYKEVLKIGRILAKNNPKEYLPVVAQTLNVLANFHTVRNEFPQALEKYEEEL